MNSLFSPPSMFTRRTIISSLFNGPPLSQIISECYQTDLHQIFRIGINLWVQMNDLTVFRSLNGNRFWGQISEIVLPNLCSSHCHSETDWM